MKDSVKKLILLGSIVVVIVGIYLIKGLTEATDFHDKYDGYDLTQDVEGASREGTYSKYLLAHQDASCPEKDVEVDVLKYVSGEGIKSHSEYQGAKDVLFTESDSTVTWEVNVPEAGFYNIYLEYLAAQSRGIAVERAFYINGELPFTNAGNITFTRMWVDGGEVKVDNQGNEIRPTQVEKYDWQSAYCRDDRGYVEEPYQFYFKKGTNTITLKGINEPMALKKLTLKAMEELASYEEYLAAQKGAPATGEGLTYLNVIQGEDASVRSESSLYAKYDRGSATTSPYSVTKTILNYTGGEAWKTAGQWIQWDFEVPEDGFYHITVKGRQNYSRGSVSSRRLYIDGVTPFEEAKRVEFEYGSDWNTMTLADDEGTPYQFYLTKGAHTIRLEASLGGIGTVLREIEDSTYRLNQMYRTILVYTGATPDVYRDYRIDKVYPEVLEAMDLEYKRLYKLVDDAVLYTGQKAEQIATVQTLARQLEKFVKRPDKISVEFTSFKDNITALGTASLNMSESKLDIDYLVVSGTDAKVPVDKANAFEKVWHEIKSFVASYIVDYDAVGDVYDDSDDEVIKVWVLTGRDQGTIVKSMVDDSFTPETGIKVNVEIVGADALLNAVLAGRGPNIALSVGANIPVDYALRGAAEDLTQFDDLDEILPRFTESSYKQYGLDGALYALPETMTFQMMFYRKDIMEELELELPNTWEDLIAILPTIQCNNMSVGIPSAAGSSGVATSDLSMYFSLLYQYGGDMYNENGTRAITDNEAGVAAFADYTEYFTDYGLPTVYDFATRFRSGEMPLAIAPFSTYNTLVVSAPEIRGLWDFTLIPGTERVDEDGNTYIDRSDFISGSATLMLKTEDDSLRDKSWEFMKWWSSAESQVRFGREMEALLGASARYATANREAFSQLAWSANNIKVLNEQWDQTVGIREVPGGYFTGRHITNAIRRIINTQEDPRETILDYTMDINDEIAKKRAEFGMPLE